MNRWRVRYRDISSPEHKYFEIAAATDHEAVEAFLKYVDENDIVFRLPTIGEQEGQPVVGFLVSVLSDGVWVDPSSVGL